MYASSSRYRPSPAFVWGPPGTGKTTTLSHIVLALLELDDQRILITSTTNAAVDQGLSKLMELALARAALERVEIVRVGQGGEHSDASLHQVVEKLNQQTRQQLNILHQRWGQIQSQIEGCGQLLRALTEADTPQQLGLFAVAEPSALSPWQLVQLSVKGMSAASSAWPRLSNSGSSAEHQRRLRDGTGPAYRTRGGVQSRPAP